MESLRAEIDKRTPHPELTKGLKRSDKKLEEAVTYGKETEKSSASKAASWREQIAAIRDQAKK